MDELKSFAKEILKEVVIVEAKIPAGAMSRVGNSIEEKKMIMGHAKEIIKMDVYGDNQNIIDEEIPELSAYMDEVLQKDEKLEPEIGEESDMCDNTEAYVPMAERYRGKQKTEDICINIEGFLP